MPLHWGQEATQNQSDEGAGDRGDVVDAQTEAALMGGEGVGDDGRRVGEEHGATHPLADPHGDEPDGTCGTSEPGDR